VVALAVVSDSQGAVVLIAMFVGLSLMFVWIVAIVAAVHPHHTLNIANIQTSPNKMVDNILVSFILLWHG
jgi:Na+/H+ antiporter NhaA